MSLVMRGTAFTFFSGNDYLKNSNIYYWLDVVIGMASLCWTLNQGVCYSITFSFTETLSCS